MPPGVPRFHPIGKNFLDFFGRFRSQTRNMEGLYSGIIPVSLVDRFRDDDEGSVFGLSAASPGLANELTSIAWGSAENDWELHALWFRVAVGGIVAGSLSWNHLFTPIDPYNPVATPNPVGFFVPGLILNKSFTLGSVTAVGGTNPVLAPIIGPVFDPSYIIVAGNPLAQFGIRYFDPPLRVYRNVTLAMQSLNSLPPNPQRLEVEILYTERPRST